MRAIGAILAIAILVAAAVFFSSFPGHVEIVWRGWQIDTSAGVLVAAAIVVALFVALILRMLSLILGSPRAFLRRRRERQRRAGYQALTRGMVAVAAGDPQEAQRHARRAEALLAEPPLTLLLSAQAAQLSGDERAAKRFFNSMLDRPETEFLGLRGLLNQALHEGDRGTALRLAERAAALRPKTEWAVQSLLDLEIRAGRWQSARETLAKAVKSGIVAPALAGHHRGVIDYELSCLAVAAGDRARGLALAAEAQPLAPDLAPLAAHHARLLLEAGRTGRAAKAIERAWRNAPHPDLAEVYRTIEHTGSTASQLARCERLAAQNPGARESHIMLAEAALTAQLWGEARRHLEAALRADSPPLAQPPANPPRIAPPLLPEAGRDGDHDQLAGITQRLCHLMARLEEAERGDPAAAREWLDRAIRALPDPRYICRCCGGDTLDWSAFCPRCGAFDALAWRTPASSGLASVVRGIAGNRSANTLASSNSGGSSNGDRFSD
jgi:HemY protein